MSPRHGSQVLADLVAEAQRRPGLTAKRGRAPKPSSAARRKAQEANTVKIARKGSDQSIPPLGNHPE